MQVLIVGAGIGGLTAALGLLQAGHQVRVFERRADGGELGAGLQLGANATGILQRYGLGAALEGFGFRPQAAELRLGRSGRRVFSVPLGAKAQARYGAPYYQMHRADLYEALRDAVLALDGDALVFSRTVSGFSQTTKAASLAFEEGPPVEGDVVVGADGLGSALRTTLLGPDAPRFTGHVAYRLLVPTAALPDGLVAPNATVWAGPGGHVVTYYVRGGAYVNVVAVVEQDGWHKETWTEPGDVNALRAAFAGWHSIVTEVLGAAENCFKWALFDRAPLARWSEGRVTLLGDACHPMLPFLAQGAAMAIEDGAALARWLTFGGSVETALRFYQDERLARTARVQEGARRNGRWFHRKNIASQLGTYGPMMVADRFMPGLIQTQLDWLYDYKDAGKIVSPAS